MKYHIDHKVVLNTDSRHKALYDWSLQEVDDDGKQVGQDQVPWDWALYFTVTEIALNETLSMEPEYAREPEPASITVGDRRLIRAKLRSGDPRDIARDRYPSYSMFGTNRRITEFELTIVKLEAEGGQERCEAWGGVSYTDEIDFRNETVEDSFAFQLYVSPERFERYVEAVRSSTIDEAVLRVRRVEGFYSEWSPAISTNHVKVLTNYEKEQVVTRPEGCELDAPRLGKVGECELTIRRVGKLDTSKFEKAEEEPEVDDLAVVLTQTSAPNPADTGDRIMSMLNTVRLAVWVVAALLLLLLLK